MPTLALVLFWLFNACSGPQGPGATAKAGKPLRVLGDSRVLSFRRTAAMDTITAILEGKAVNLCNQRPVPVTVQLVSGTTSYRAVAAPDGTFRFFHIPAGKYTLTAMHPACRPLAPSPVKLGSGDIAEVKLGMGCDAGKP